MKTIYITKIITHLNSISIKHNTNYSFYMSSYEELIKLDEKKLERIYKQLRGKLK